uniref:Uncharacterized protein n=1 Tax=Rhizophora mucronata TaxID=61149 RepID=A0A2P2M7D3_RHIMU
MLTTFNIIQTHGFSAITGMTCTGQAPQVAPTCSYSFGSCLMKIEVNRTETSNSVPYYSKTLLFLSR